MQPKGPQRLPRFRVRSLLIAMGVVAVVAAILFQLPGWVGLVAAAALDVAVRAVLVVGAVKSRGDRQLFCLGALLPFVFRYDPVAGLATTLPSNMISNGYFGGVSRLAGPIALVSLLIYGVAGAFGGWVAVQVSWRFSGLFSRGEFAPHSGGEPPVAVD